MARRSILRASDADRELVTQRLQRASTEGRLAADELEQRVGRALSARTYGELDAIVDDLPASRHSLRARRRRERRELTGLRPALTVAIVAPVVLALVVALVFALTGVLATWALWLGVGWLLLRRRRRLWLARGYRADRWRAHRRSHTSGAPADPRTYWA